MTNIHHRLDLRGMGVFLQAARDGNFTVTAERLNMTQSAVSKAIGRLEAELGATLFRRSPRAVVLTLEGTLFLEEAERVRAAAERARNVLESRAAVPRRTLRIALPIHFGRTQIAPRLPMFLERYPTIKLEYLLVNNGQIDPIERRIDVALQIGMLATPHRQVLAETIAQLDMVLCAAPQYLERHGRPETLAELTKHRTLGGIDEVHDRVMAWRFGGSRQGVAHPPDFSVTTNSIEVLFDLAVAGGGIVHLPYYMAADGIRQGRLSIVLPRRELAPIPVQVTQLRARANDVEVKAFVALLRETVEQQNIGYLRRRHPT